MYIYIGMTRTNELTMMMTYNNDNNNLITMNELIMTMIVLITIVLIVMTIPEPAASLGSMASSDMVGLHLSPNSKFPKIGLPIPTPNHPFLLGMFHYKQGIPHL